MLEKFLMAYFISWTVNFSFPSSNFFKYSLTSRSEYVPLYSARTEHSVVIQSVVYIIYNIICIQYWKNRKRNREKFYFETDFRFHIGIITNNSRKMIFSIPTRPPLSHTYVFTFLRFAYVSVFIRDFVFRRISCTE